MEREIAELIVDFGIDLRLHEDYSGRCMYGSTTDGVVGSESDFMNAIGEAFNDLVERALDVNPTSEEKFDNDEHEEIVKLTSELSGVLEGMRTDSMGMDVIFY